MKRLWIFTVILFIFTLPTFSNPIAVTYFNEIQFTESGWIIEIHPSVPLGDMQLDSALLMSKSDTAYIKPFSLTDNSYVLLTQDSLTSQFRIDPENDTLHFFSECINYSYIQDYIILGDITVSSSQSLSLLPENGWYIDNSPTLGFENDAEGGQGTIHLQFVDQYQDSIPKVRIFLGMVQYPNGFQYDSSFVYSDSSGFYSYTGWARYRRFSEFKKVGYETTDTTVFIYPDSIQNIVVVLEKIGSGIQSHRTHFASQFYLSPVYPNPFNNSTNFSYRLPNDSFVTLLVYSLTGNKVVDLFKGYRYAGDYQVNWSADGLSSGIYIIRLYANNQQLQRKCLLIK